MTDDKHGREDHDAVTRVWAALGISSYTGKPLWEETEAVVAALAEERGLGDELAAELGVVDVGWQTESVSRLLARHRAMREGR